MQFHVISKKFPGFLLLLKYKLSDVRDELSGYNMYRSAKTVMDYFITPEIPGILKNVEEKSRDFLLYQDWKLYSCMCMEHKLFREHTLYSCSYHEHT